MSLHYIIFVLLISLTFAKRYGSFGHGRSSHTYPHQTHGYSGSNVNHGQTYHQANRDHSYPESTGLSGNKQRGHQQPAANVHNTHYSHTSKTEVHHHYHYNPPPHITYGSQTLPVYHGSPPVYVYQYRDSGSRFDTLLTGLALYNLGKMSAHHHHDNYRYESRPGEICKLGIRKSNGDYEETRVNCQLMTSFIWETETERNHVPKTTNTHTSSVVTQTITNTNGSVSSVTTTNTTTVVDALAAKGPSIQVTPDMTCYLIRTASDSTRMQKTVDCAILQTYAMSSMSRNASIRLTPTLRVFLLSNLIFVLSC